MADLIHDQTCLFDTAVDAQSLITMAQAHNETETGLTAAFNQTATEQTSTFDAAVDALSLFTIAQSKDKTDTSLTADFNTEFVSQIVFDIFLEFGLAAEIGSFDEGGIPIIFYSRTSPEPIIFYSRTSPEPAIFYARGETQRAINKIDSGLSAPFNFTFEQAIPTVDSDDVETLITMAQSHDESEAGLEAAFSTAVV